MNTLRSYSPHFAAIQKNAEIKFRLNWTIKIFNENAFCTFIPKNACSSIRYNVALKNNILRKDDPKGFSWIHKNNLSFNVNIEEAITSRYSFVVLRCPFSRIIATYLDKFLTKEIQAWRFIDAIGKEIDLDDLTFKKFVQLLLKNQSLRQLDPHWMPQHKFLLLEEYSNYFCIENFQEAKKIIYDALSMDLVDTRHISKHTTISLNKNDIPEAYNIPAYELYKLKKDENTIPNPFSMLDSEIYEALEKIYKHDLELYASKCSADYILQI